MRMVYTVLAFAVAGLVVVQAAAIAFAVFGLSAWIEQGGTLDAAAMQNEVTFPGVVGFMIHGMFGSMVIPAVADDTMKSRGLTAPRTVPARSVTSTISALRSSRSSSAAAAESPRITIGGSLVMTSAAVLPSSCTAAAPSPVPPE